MKNKHFLFLQCTCVFHVQYEINEWLLSAMLSPLFYGNIVLNIFCICHELLLS